MEKASTFEAEKNPPEGENNFEKETVMEGFREERASILEAIMSRKVAEAALLLTPGLDVASLVTFAAKGETLAGKELNGRSRIRYAAIAGFLATFYALHLSGMHKEALAARGIAATLSGIEFGPEIIEGASGLAEKRFPSIKEFIQKTGGFIKNEFPSIEDVHNSIINFANRDPDLIALNIYE